MPEIDVTVYYLEMFSRPGGAAPAPGEGVAVVHAKKPSAGFYRFLYNSVGEGYYWYSRARRSDAELAALVQHPLNEVHVLYVEGTPAGFAELDRRQPDEIELIQFGLMPEFIGQGLGKWFLQWTIDRAWSYSPRRFWLHTCTLDHPSALANYLKRGFKLFNQEVKQHPRPVLPPGRYRHFKGHDYTLLGVARHSESEEELVVYRQEYGDRSLWCRPRPMFEETVTLDGETVPRFQYVAPKASNCAAPD
ncbi:MAG TPA: GNAT family N-acetyltransferase [Pirellulales bacterium]|nr:GNAT family N-acetyltransferase [Pirellulales bacterium]